MSPNLKKNYFLIKKKKCGLKDFTIVPEGCSCLQELEKAARSAVIGFYLCWN